MKRDAPKRDAPMRRAAGTRRRIDPVQVAVWSKLGGLPGTTASVTLSQWIRSVDTACPIAARRCRSSGSCSARDAYRKNAW